MIYTSSYFSPIGEMKIYEKENLIIGISFLDQKYLFVFKEECVEEETVLIKNLKECLAKYFGGEKVDFKDIPIKPSGTIFQEEVWNILKSIPYGATKSYGDIAKEIARNKGVKKMSAQAVGSSIGHNPILILIPCHRVVSSDGSLGGFSAGIKRKEYLLNLEKSLQ